MQSEILESDTAGGGDDGLKGARESEGEGGVEGEGEKEENINEERGGGEGEGREEGRREEEGGVTGEGGRQGEGKEEEGKSTTEERQENSVSEGGGGEGEEGRGGGEGEEGGGGEGEEGRGGGEGEEGGGGEGEEKDSQEVVQLTVALTAAAENDKENEERTVQVGDGATVGGGMEEEKEHEGEKEVEGGGEEDSPRGKERKASKDQLLKSAGIQLQGSSETDITGAPLKTDDDATQSSQDRNLEQFSEILLDSDLSPTDSETGLCLPEGGAQATGESQGGEGGKSKSERRVRFADEVLEATDNTGRILRNSGVSYQQCFI